VYQRVKDDLNKLDLYIKYKTFINDCYKLLGKELCVTNHAEMSKQLVEAEGKTSQVIYILGLAKAQQDIVIGQAWRAKPAGHGNAQRNKAEADEETYPYTLLRNMLEYILDNINARLSLGKRLLEQ
jgi:hypothetical protein